MGNTHGNEPWVKKPWVYETFLVVIAHQIRWVKEGKLICLCIEKELFKV
jgi:hypothetical protein